MNDNNLKQLWNDASKIIEENNKLSELDIQESLEHKSNGVIAKFRREKQLGLLMLWFLPALGIVEIVNSNFSPFSLLFFTLLLVVAIWANSLVRKQLKNLDSFEENDSINHALKSKIQILKAYFKYGRRIAPIIGLTLMDASIILVNLIDTGKLPAEYSFWGLMLLLSIGYWFLIRFISQKQEEKYIVPLEHCLDMMNDISITREIKTPKSNVTLIVVIVLIILLLLNIAMYFFK